MLISGADVNATDGVDTALIVACKSYNEAIVKMLLNNGADINLENSESRTALYVAVTRGHAAYKREQSNKDLEDSTNVVHFRNSPHTNMVFLLLKAGAHLNETSSGLDPCTVHLQPPYSDSPNIHILKILSVAGAEDKDTDTEENRTLKDETRFCIRRHLQQSHPESNLYHIVSKLGKLSLPFILQSYLLFDTIPKGYQNLKNDEREMLLKVSEGDIENAAELIHAGVDVNVQNENGMTALMRASDAGHVDLIEELYRKGADVNIQNSLGDTALILATLKARNNCVEVLLKFGAYANIQSNDGLTALMYAAMSGNKTCLQMLLDSGADPNIPNDDDGADRKIRVGRLIFFGGAKGSTAITYAARHGKTDCVKKLIEAGADVNNASQDKEGNTPLMEAINVWNVQCVRELIQAGADLNIPDKNGQTALMITSGDIRNEIFPKLMKAGAEVNPAFLADIARKLLMEENTGGIHVNFYIVINL